MVVDFPQHWAMNAITVAAIRNQDNPELRFPLNRLSGESIHVAY